MKLVSELQRNVPKEKRRTLLHPNAHHPLPCGYCRRTTGVLPTANAAEDLSTAISADAATSCVTHGRQRSSWSRVCCVNVFFHRAMCKTALFLRLHRSRVKKQASNVWFRGTHFNFILFYFHLSEPAMSVIFETWRKRFIHLSDLKPEVLGNHFLNNNINSLFFFYFPYICIYLIAFITVKN